MPQELRGDPPRRIGTYRSRVFVGGSYHQEERSRLAEIKAEIVKAGFESVVADEVQLENEGDIHHETMVLLHSCRLAVFELSQLSGALMEIERVPGLRNPGAGLIRRAQQSNIFAIAYVKHVY